MICIQDAKRELQKIAAGFLDVLVVPGVCQIVTGYYVQDYQLFEEALLKRFCITEIDKYSYTANPNIRHELYMEIKESKHPFLVQFFESLASVVVYGGERYPDWPFHYELIQALGVARNGRCHRTKCYWPNGNCTCGRPVYGASLRRAS